MPKIMAKYSQEECRDATEYANELARLAASAPNRVVRRLTFQAVNTIRETFGFTRDQKFRILWSHLSDGCRTYNDLVNVTRWRKDDIIALVADMVALKYVKTDQMGVSTGGRKATFIQPIVENPHFVHPKN